MLPLYTYGILINILCSQMLFRRGSYFMQYKLTKEDTASASEVYSIRFAPYRLQFRTPLRMARGLIEERSGILIKLSLGQQAGYADLMPLEHFGTESLLEATEYLSKLKEATLEQLLDIPAGLPATAFALEVALAELKSMSDELEYSRQRMPVSMLLPANDTIYSALQCGLDEGYSIFKVKIGCADFADELSMLRGITARLPQDTKLRVDANEGLTFDEARRWTEHLDMLPIEFLEQPLKRDSIEETIRLTEYCSTEIALDESIATTRDIIRCYDAGFRGVFAVKPMRLQELGNFLSWRISTEAKISYSTAFESAIGSVFGIKLAATDTRNSYGLGYGVNNWFSNPALILPVTSQVDLQEILKFQPERIWSKALSDSA